MFVQGSSEAYSEHPRKHPVCPPRTTMTPAPHYSQTGGLASHEALVQRETSPAMTAKAPPAIARGGGA